MTGILTDLMHDRADRLDAPDVDVAAITRDGERVLRRRRATVAAGGVAAVALAAAIASAALFGRGGPADDLVAAAPTERLDQLSWTTGHTLHSGDGSSVELAATVRAWVWVGDDVVYTDPTGRVHLWQAGLETVIGTIGRPEGDVAELVTDGSMVAWVAPDDRVVRYDVSDGTSVRSPAMPGSRLRVTAADGAEVYAASSGGVFAWRTSEADAYRTLDADPRAVVLDAEDGTLVQSAPDRTVLVERVGGRLRVSAREFADLAPDGRLLSLENKVTGQIVDTTTGDDVTFVQDHEWAVGYEWLDATTVAVLAFDGLADESSMTGHLLVCDATSGACAESGLPLESRLGQFQLPAGIHLS